MSNFGESHFPGRSQIPDPTLFFSEIVDLENTPPDSVRSSHQINN